MAGFANVKIGFIIFIFRGVYFILNLLKRKSPLHFTLKAGVMIYTAKKRNRMRREEDKI